jgi:predicted signal transduction protein with EAL and GGDEF domain
VRLQNKLLLLILPLVVLPLLGLGWIAYERMRVSARDTSLREMDTIVKQLHINLTALVRTAEANIELFANSPLLHKYVLTENEQQRFELLQRALLDLFASYQEAYPEYFEIRVLSPDGHEDTRMALSEVPNVTEEEAETPYFRHLVASSEPVYSEFFHSPDTGEPVLLVGKALKLRDLTVQTIEAAPRLRAYLVLTCRLETLKRQIETLSGGHNTILFTDQQGHLLFTSGGALANQLQLPDLIEVLHRTGENQGLLRFDYRGEMTLFRAEPVIRQFYLFVGRPERLLLADSRQIGLAVAAVTLASILATALSLFAVLQRLLLQPIKRLGQAVQEISHGNLAVTTVITGHDELGELAQSFHEMSRSLQYSRRQIEALAYHDNLTGLPNRLMFKEYLERSLAHVKRSDKPLALMFIDLDNFKHVNDTLGHEAGDALLREVARRLHISVREEDIVARVDSPLLDMVARLGGDEFVIQLVGLRSTDDAGRVAQRVLKALTCPVKLSIGEVYIGASIGITIAPDDGLDVETLVHHADIAMYHAKQHGKNQYCYFNQAMNVRVVQHLTMDTKLRRALDQRQLSLHYQPIVELATGQLVGFEALLRWEDPELGLVSPASFIPIAEEIGLIVPISEWVLTEACRQLMAWQGSGLGQLSVAVNLSGVHVNRRTVCAMLAHALENSELSPQYLEIELTETSLMSVEIDAVQVLQDIKQLGVKIAIDNFGTGYSSLNYLRNFPINHLKIDRSFISDLTATNGNRAIVSAIVAMAHSLGLQVIAEGVETEIQMEVLRTLGCNYVQGYLFSRPLTPPELVPLFNQQIPWAHLLTTTNIETLPRRSTQHQR